MPTTDINDNFNHGDFTVPGGGPYRAVEGTPTKDTSVTQGSDPASMLINPVAAAENVQYNYTGTRTLVGIGFWFRISTEPASTTIFARFFPAAGSQGKISWQTSTNFIFHDITGASFPTSTALSLDTWYWISSTFKVDEATRRMRTRIYSDPTTFQDLTALDEAVAATTDVTHVAVGATAAADTWVGRFSNVYVFIPSSITDHMAPPGSAGGGTGTQSGQRMMTLGVG